MHRSSFWKSEGSSGLLLTARAVPVMYAKPFESVWFEEESELVLLFLLALTRQTAIPVAIPLQHAQHQLTLCDSF